jgi:hypothetical protein
MDTQAGHKLFAVRLYDVGGTPVGFIREGDTEVRGFRSMDEANTAGKAIVDQFGGVESFEVVTVTPVNLCHDYLVGVVERQWVKAVWEPIRSDVDLDPRKKW